MRRLLITGASGFLGGHIWNHAESKFQCLGTYHSRKDDRYPGEWIHLDLGNEDQIRTILDEVRPDAVIHNAAMSNLDVCQIEKERAKAVNTRSAEIIAEYCGENNVRLVFVSSDMVFDGERGMYREDDPTNPVSIYGQSKVDAENAVRKLIKDHVIVRAALIYGKPVYGGSSFSMWIENQLAAGKKVPLYVDQYRTPVYAPNLAEILVELVDSDFSGTLHVGGTNRINRYDFGVQLCQAGGYPEGLLEKSLMSTAGQAAPRPRDISLSTDLAKSVLKTRLLSTREGLLKMFNQ